MYSLCMKTAFVIARCICAAVRSWNTFFCCLCSSAFAPVCFTPRATLQETLLPWFRKRGATWLVYVSSRGRQTACAYQGSNCLSTVFWAVLCRLFYLFSTPSSPLTFTHIHLCLLTLLPLWLCHRVPTLVHFFFIYSSPPPLLLQLSPSLSSPFQIMTERKNAKAMAGGSLQERMQAGLDLPLQGRLYACLCVCARVRRSACLCAREGERVTDSECDKRQASICTAARLAKTCVAYD